MPLLTAPRRAPAAAMALAHAARAGRRRVVVLTLAIHRDAQVRPEEAARGSRPASTHGQLVRRCRAVTAGVAVAVSASTVGPAEASIDGVAQRQEVGAEVAPPLADAVGLVHDDEAQVAAARQHAARRDASSPSGAA